MSRRPPDDKTPQKRNTPVRRASQAKEPPAAQPAKRRTTTPAKPAGAGKAGSVARPAGDGQRRASKREEAERAGKPPGVARTRARVREREPQQVVRERRPAAARTVDAVRVYGAGPAAVRALAGVTVEFEAGRFTAIMGPSGSGKSTLLHCAAGLDRLTSGHAFIGDDDLTKLDEKRLTVLRRDKIGFVFQAFNLVPTLSARENITLPLDLADRKADPAWVDTIVKTLQLSDRLEHRPSELSGGQQQRVAAARALASRPAIVFADEPTGNLDSRSSAELLGFLRHAVDEFEQTIVMVTHDPMGAGRTDHVVFLADGRVVDEMDEPTAAKVLDRIKALEP